MMKRSRSAGLFVFAVFLAVATISGQQPAQTAQAVPGELLVRFRPQLTETGRGAARATARVSRIRQFSQLNIEHVRVAPGTATASAIVALRSNPYVLSADPNYVRRLVASAPPNDPFWLSDSLWGLQRIMAQTAWTNFPITGPAVVVADIDTGVNYGHPDLAASMWRNPAETPGNGVDDDGNGYVDDVYGIDTVNRDSDPMDDNGHGTHVAGTIAATGNNGIGIVGVNAQARVLACKFLDETGTGSDADAIACFNYVVALKKRGVNLRVTSNSWGSPRSGSVPQALQSAIDAAGAAGILNVFAAGNEGTNTDVAPFDPASLPLDHIVSVAASDGTDNRPPFSNYGPTSVDLAAPGVSILSTYGNGYAYLSGTSMAAPHVAGSASFLFAVRPALNVSDVKALLLGNVDRLGNWSGIVSSGGRLNLFGAGLAAYGNVGPTVAITSPADNSTVTAGAPLIVSADASDPDGHVVSVAFFADGVPLGTDTAEPYAVSWSNPTPGSHVLTAVATDNAISATTSRAVTITAAAFGPSPDGTVLPPASQIVDAQGGVWTIGPGQLILRDGQSAASGYGSQILWSNGSIFVFGDHSWWRWSGNGWTNVGGAPGGSTGASPNGTAVPPAPEIVDAQGNVWTIGGNRTILRNAQHASGGYGTEILWLNGDIYVFGADIRWYVWTGAAWKDIGASHP